MNTYTLRKAESRLRTLVQGLQNLDDDVAGLPVPAVVDTLKLAKHRAYDALVALRAHIEKTRSPRGKRKKVTDGDTARVDG